MDPMLSGLIPLFVPGNGVSVRDAAGELVREEINRSGSIDYLGGPGGDGTVAYLPPIAIPDQDRLADQPVAVWIGGQTIIAGEVVAITFAGGEQTRFFSEATGGLATAPTFLHPLDGSLLSTTTGWDVGLNSAVYPAGIGPDVVVSLANVVYDPVTNDPVVRAASAWLTGLPSCQEMLPTPTP